MLCHAVALVSCPAAFQQIEVDYAIASTEQAPPGMYQGARRQVPVVRLYGVNDNGNSVCAFVHGFEPYFLVEKPSFWNIDHTEALKQQLNVSTKRSSCLPVLTARPELLLLLHEARACMWISGLGGWQSPSLGPGSLLCRHQHAAKRLSRRMLAAVPARHAMPCAAPCSGCWPTRPRTWAARPSRASRR